MARRLFDGFLVNSSRYRCIRLPLLLSSEKSCAASFSTTRNIFANESGQQTGAEASKKSTAKTSAEDRIRKFTDPNVQSLLRELTGLKYEIVFRRRRLGQIPKEPKYTFMTEEQLVKSVDEAKKKTEMLLQMPPVLPPRKPIDKVLSWDPDLQGYEKEGVTLLCCDITPHGTDRNRLIVAREPNGLLRYASWEEREKLNHIYFPRLHRKVKIPKMLSNPELLSNVLARVETDPKDNVYEFVCDRACLQFEPDDPRYISTVETVYQAIDRLQHYDYLYSTRHYGPMCFHFVRYHKLDKLLSFYIKNERVPDASNLVSLFHLVFPECKSAQEKVTDIHEKISKYIELDGVQKSELSLIWNAYMEQERIKLELEKGLKVAHGQ